MVVSGTQKARSHLTEAWLTFCGSLLLLSADQLQCPFAFLQLKEAPGRKSGKVDNPGEEFVSHAAFWSGLTLIVSLFECHDFEVAPVGPTGWRWPWSSVAAWFLLAAAFRWATVATIRNFILGSYRPELAGQFQMLCGKACQDLLSSSLHVCLISVYTWSHFDFACYGIYIYIFMYNYIHIIFSSSLIILVSAIFFAHILTHRLSLHGTSERRQGNWGAFRGERRYGVLTASVSELWG